MSGTYIVGEAKIRPGVYHRRYREDAEPIAGARNGIGLGIIRANWGPLNTVVEFTPDTKVSRVFGSGNTEDLITEMFTGGITSGFFVRAGSGGTAPTITLKDTTEESAVEVVKIEGAYVGDRAFTVSVRDSLGGDGRECIFYDGTTEFCKISFAGGETEPQALVDAINAGTSDFKASKLADGNGILAVVTQTAMTPGAQPTTNTEAYSAALEALYAAEGNCLCVDTEDVDVHALVQAWINRVYINGMYTMACLSEKKETPLATRLQHGGAFNDEKIVYVLNSATSSTGPVYEGWRVAARIGGMIASVPSNTSLTHEVVSGFTDLNEALTPSEIEKGLKGGCLVLTKNRSGQVWIEQGINTLITPSADMDDGWKKIRRVKTRFELMQRIDDTTDPLTGKVDNDDDGRATIIASIKGVIGKMVGEKKLLQGDCRLDEDNPPKGDSAWFIIEVDDNDSIEFIYLAYRFRYAAE